MYYWFYYEFCVVVSGIEDGRRERREREERKEEFLIDILVYLVINY